MLSPIVLCCFSSFFLPGAHSQHEHARISLQNIMAHAVIGRWRELITYVHSWEGIKCGRTPMPQMFGTQETCTPCMCLGDSDSACQVHFHSPCVCITPWHERSSSIFPLLWKASGRRSCLAHSTTCCYSYPARIHTLMIGSIL